MFAGYDSTKSRPRQSKSFTAADQLTRDFSHRWINAGPTSKMVARHFPSNGLLCHVNWRAHSPSMWLLVVVVIIISVSTVCIVDTQWPVMC